MINKDAIKFIKAFNYDDGKFALRTFYDKKTNLKGVEKKENNIRCNCCGKYYPEKDVYLGIKDRPICKNCSPIKVTTTLEELENKWSRLLFYKNNHCFHGVHLAINGAHTDKEVKKVYAQFFEIDDKSFEEQEQIIKSLKLKPSMIVKTRKSYHIYYLIQNGKLSLFREIQQRLAYTFGGDMQKKNESTCMRIPGFYHNKKDPIMVKLVSYHPELIYTQSQLITKLELLKLPIIEKRNKFSFNYDKYKDELLDMVYNHIYENIVYDKGNKFIMECINPMHEDNNPSAVFFKDSLYFYCKGCGYSKNLFEAAKEQGWTDIINFILTRKAS